MRLSLALIALVFAGSVAAQSATPIRVTIALTEEFPEPDGIAVVIHSAGERLGVILLREDADPTSLMAALASYRRIRKQSAPVRVVIKAVKGIDGTPSERLDWARELLKNLRETPQMPREGLGMVRSRDVSFEP